MLTSCGIRYSIPEHLKSIHKSKILERLIEKCARNKMFFTHHHHNVRNDIAMLANHCSQMSDCEWNVFANSWLCFFFYGYNTIAFRVRFFFLWFLLFSNELFLFLNVIHMKNQNENTSTQMIRNKRNTIQNDTISYIQKWYKFLNWETCNGKIGKKNQIKQKITNENYKKKNKKLKSYRQSILMGWHLDRSMYFRWAVWMFSIVSYCDASTTHIWNWKYRQISH